MPHNTLFVFCHYRPEAPVVPSIAALRRFDGVHWNATEQHAPFAGIESLKEMYRMARQMSRDQRDSEKASSSLLLSTDFQRIDQIWKDPERLEAREVSGVELVGLMSYFIKFTVKISTDSSIPLLICSFVFA